MYTSYYGLDAKPFSITPDPDTLYLSPDHKEALAHIEYGLMRSIGLMVLTGDVGTGKTTILRYTAEHFCDDKQIIAIYQANLSPKELFDMILIGLGIDIHGNRKHQQLNDLKKYLENRNKDKKQALIIVDEAQGLSDETLEEVRLLTNIQMDYPDAFHILLVGQPEFLERLQSPQWVSLGQRIGISYHLKALDLGQTCWYVAHRLSRVGGELKLFSKDSLKSIYKHSEGVPRLINIICDGALVYGYGDELKTITASIIEKVVKERAGMGFAKPSPPSNGHKAENAPIAGNVHYEERFKIIEETLVQIKNQLQVQMEDISILSTRSKEDLFTVVKKIVAKERRRRKQLELEIKELKQSFKKAGIAYVNKKGDLSKLPKSARILYQELTQQTTVK